MKMHRTSSYPYLQLTAMTHGMTDAWPHGSPDLSPPSLKWDLIIVLKSSGVSAIYSSLIETCHGAPSEKEWKAVYTSRVILL